MRISTLVLVGVTLGLLVGLATTHSHAQTSSITGPILGFVPETSSSSVRPILGIPDASLLGEPLGFGSEVRMVAISPKQDFGVAVRKEDAQFVLIPFRENLEMIPIFGTATEDSLIAISPTGSAVAQLDSDSRRVRFMTGSTEFDVSMVPGRITQLGISDDAAVALLKSTAEDGDSLWVVDASNAPRQIALDRPGAFAFFPKRRDVAAIEESNKSVVVIRNVDADATRIPLFSANETIATLSSVAALDDARQVVVADGNIGIVAVVDVETGMASYTSCSCRPTGLFRLKGTSIFRLEDPSQEPIWILDASSEPRTIVIPPASKGAPR